MHMASTITALPLYVVIRHNGTRTFATGVVGNHGRVLVKNRHVYAGSFSSVIEGSNF